VHLAVLAQLLEGLQAGGASVEWELDRCEGVPEVFAQGGGDGFLAIEGQLAEGMVVLLLLALGGELSHMDFLEGWGDVYTR
jgi:hypothetical protein